MRDVEDESTLIPVVKTAEVETLVADGIISGGMIPKVKSLEKAVDCGVEKAVMIDGRIEHSILIEMFSDEGIGTMFVNQRAFVLHIAHQPADIRQSNNVFRFQGRRNLRRRRIGVNIVNTALGLWTDCAIQTRKRRKSYRWFWRARRIKTLFH